MSGVELHEKLYAPGTELASHSHEHATLILVLDGGFREDCAGEEIARSPGQLRVMPPGFPHANRYGRQGAQCFVVELYDAWLDQGADRVRSVDRVANFARRVPQSVIAQRIWEDFRVMDDAASLSVEGLLLETLGLILRQESDRAPARLPHWLRDARDRLHEEFVCPPRIGELAEQAEVHPGHLHRAFRRHFGCTPGDYVRARRIAFARGALLESDEPIASIAQRAGFSDQAHFTRCFRAATGLPPGVFRQRGGLG